MRQDHMTQDEYDDAVIRLMGGDDSRGVPDEAIEADRELGAAWLTVIYWPRLRAALAAVNLAPEHFSSDARARVYIGTVNGVDPIDGTPRKYTGYPTGTDACLRFALECWGPDRGLTPQVLTGAGANTEIERGYSPK